MMTDNKIKEKLQQYFKNTGSISIENGLVSCSGSLSIRQDIKVTALPVKFKTVDGDFECEGNNQLIKLTTLAGAPQSVGGDFYCNNNPLSSLTGAPQTVGGEFNCIENQLISLVGAPQTVGGDFYCRNNPLSSLTGAPRYIQGEFWLSYAKNLPLLPLLKIRGCKKVEFIDTLNIGTNEDLSAILNRYLGTGTRGMLPCAMEMIKAGYGSNAKL